MRWQPERISPLVAALLAQCGGALVAALLAELLWPPLWQLPLAAALFQGAFAAMISLKLAAPPWWLPIHLAFMPLVVLAGRLPIAPGWYLGAFVLLVLVFWRTDKSRVPLYLSNARTAAAVAGLLPAWPCRIIDLGCGDGGLLRQLARTRPDCEFLGIEHAPLTVAWAWLATLNQPNVQVRLGDFWRQYLGPFDVVYAFLSPAPMPRLWEKARAEMRPGTLLISNSFAVPGVAAPEVVEVADRRATRLHLYRPAD